MDRKPQLLDIRQIGPDSEKDISGKCSACGDYLLAGLEESEKPNPERLRKAGRDICPPRRSATRACSREGIFGNRYPIKIG
jgi:hypothetical protein